MTIDERVRELGLVLPDPFRSPTGAAYPFSWVQVRGNRAYISGHLPLQPEGRWPSRAGKSGRHYQLSKERRQRGWSASRCLGVFRGSWASWSESQCGCVCWEW